MKNILNILSSTHSPLLAGNFIYGIEDTAGKETAKKGAGVKSEGMGADFQKTTEEGKNILDYAKSAINNTLESVIYDDVEYAKNGNIPKKLRELSRNNDDEINYNLAGNQYIPSDIIQNLVKNGSTKVAKRIASFFPDAMNDRAFYTLLNRDDSGEFIEELAKNSSLTGKQVVSIFSKNPDLDFQTIKNHRSVTTDNFQDLVKIFMASPIPNMEGEEWEIFGNSKLTADTIRFSYKVLNKKHLPIALQYIIDCKQTPDDVLELIANRDLTNDVKPNGKGKKLQIADLANLKSYAKWVLKKRRERKRKG